MNSAQKFEKKKKPNPVLKANIFSKLLFLWTRHVFKLGLSKQLHTDGIYENLPHLDSEKLTASFQKNWETETQRENPSLLHAILVAYGWRVLPVCTLYSLVKISLDSLQPLFLAGLLSYFANKEKIADKQNAYFYAAGIVFCAVCVAFSYNVFIFHTSLNGVRLRLACAGLVYRKCLQFNVSAENSGMSGFAISVLSKDLPQFDTAFLHIHNLWKGPIETLAIGLIMWHKIGWPALVGILIIIIFTPLQVLAGKAAGRYRMESAKRGDSRSKLMNEVITSMQVIKMYVWETYFAKQIAKIRKCELKFIRRAMKLSGAMLCTLMISKLALTASLLAYVYAGEIVSSSKIFMATSYYAVLNEAFLHFWTLAITVWAETIVCIRRINTFLLYDTDIQSFKEKQIRAENYKNSDNTSTISRRVQDIESKEKSLNLKHVSGTWDRISISQSCMLHIKDINCCITDGQIVGIIGNVGSGKTTLLNAILGELHLTQGILQVNGVISYAPQDPWVFEGSIRENIVFVEKYDEKRYKDVLYACELGHDIESFPYGDSTIIGERGISLSGGQRARISLARAVYRKADIYIFDDPLSAVDSYVGRKLMEKCFLKFLNRKIRVLVTHQIQHMQHVNHLILVEAGTIKNQGSYEEIIDIIHQEIHDVAACNDLKQHSDFRRKKSFINVKIVLDEDAEKFQDDRNNRKEGQQLGSVKFHTYFAYFKALRMGWLVVGILTFFALARISHGWLDYIISRWAAHEDQLLAELQITSEDYIARRRTMMMTILLVLGTLTLYLLRTFGFYFICNKISYRLHYMLFNGVIRARMNFFDTNPSGRIINRFTNDLWKVDITLPQTMLESISFVADVGAVLFIVGLTNYWLLLPALFIIGILLAFRKLYIRSGRNLKRIECITCSPVFSHVNQTFQGLTTIRALNAKSKLESEFHSLQSYNTSAVYISLATNRAFALWIDLICALYIFLVTFSFLALENSFDSGQVGLAISQSSLLLVMCQWGIRQSADTENYMTSVERIMEYSNAPSESDLKISAETVLDPNWPHHGSIQFKDVRMRYNDAATQYSLKGLNFFIKPKEKIGIVGRTGAGKSSIIRAVFRLANNEGCIEIDGQDIAALDLHDLRKSIAIIPQEPVLFTGTLRHNLDPFDKMTDEKLWRVLNCVELQHHIMKLEGGLDCHVNDGGANFSTGQRQLICLARAILRCNKIFIMDEPTANVDRNTDRLIQDTIQANCSDCTVLTIAHRLQTVMENDKVLVMDAGRVVEMDHPHILLQNKEGHLYKLVQESGKKTAEHLLFLAKENFDRHLSK